MAPPFSSPRSPLIWFLGPLLVGLTLAPRLPDWPLVYLFCALAAILVACWLALNPRAMLWPGQNILWGTSLLLGLTFAFISYSHWRIPPENPFHPDTPARSLTLTIQVERLFQSSHPQRVNGLARIVEAPHFLPDLVGQKIHFSAFLPEEFAATAITRTTRLKATGLWQPLQVSPEDSFAQYLSTQGVTSRWNRLRNLEVVRSAHPPFAQAREAREWVRKHLNLGAREPHRYSRVLVAMLLGERIELEIDQYEAFLRTGTLHLFAISGLHIGIIGATLLCFLRILRLPRGPEIVIGLSVLLFYVEITGSPPSAVRAFLMVSFFWLARFFRQGGNPFASLANSAVLVLLWQPSQLFSAGFQLSYTVVATLLLLGVPLIDIGRKVLPFQRDARRGDKRRIRFLMLYLMGLFFISFSATLGSAVLTVHYFGHFSPGAVFLNMILVPLAGLVLVSGMVSLGFGLVQLTSLSILANHAAWTIIAIMEETVFRFLHIPWLFYRAEYRYAEAVILGWLLLAISLTLIHLRVNDSRRYLLLALPIVGLGIFFSLSLRLEIP